MSFFSMLLHLEIQQKESKEIGITVATFPERTSQIKLQILLRPKSPERTKRI